MKVDKIEKVLAAQAGKIEKLCEDTTPFFTQESIHKFRVEVKRLRSFLRLLAFSKDQPEIKLPKKFKQLYDIAGAIREAHLEEMKLAEWKISLPTYFIDLQSQATHYKQQWQSHYSFHITKELENELLNFNFNELSPHSLRLFFEDQITIIHSIVQADPNNENIHTCRKHVKDMLYIAKLMEKEWEHGYKEIASFPLKELDTLATLLGNYNDQRIMLERLMQFMPSAKDDEVTTLQTLCEELKLRQFIAKKKAIAAIENFLNTTIAWQ